MSDEERELFSIFREIVRDENINTTVRVAGGWVRDKLLGKTSKVDIDIALDNMSGTGLTPTLPCQTYIKLTNNTTDTKDISFKIVIITGMIKIVII